MFELPISSSGEQVGCFQQILLYISLCWVSACVFTYTGNCVCEGKFQGNSQSTCLSEYAGRLLLTRTLGKLFQLMFPYTFIWSDTVFLNLVICQCEKWKYYCIIVLLCISIGWCTYWFLRALYILKKLTLSFVPQILSCLSLVFKFYAKTLLFRVLNI